MTHNTNASGMVLYTDGGCRPNPGYGGWGIHGYLFEMAKNPKGVGHTTHSATAAGYISKSVLKDKKAYLSPEVLAAMSPDDIDSFEQYKGQQSTRVFNWETYAKLDKQQQSKEIIKCAIDRDRVNVLTFVDAFGTMDGIDNTNNTAELRAMTQAFTIAIDKGVDALIIRADSETVVKGITEWIYGWIDNKWVTRSGTPVKNQNQWCELKEVKDLFELTGGTVHIEWVKAHDEDIGNMSADWLATLAVYASQKGRIITQTDFTQATSEYWGSASDKRHPMLNHRYSYFVADPLSIIKNNYYIGNQGKEVDLIAKKTSDAGYAVVQIDAGDKALDFVINHQCSLNNELMSMCMVDLDSLYGPSYRYTNLYREDFLYRPLSHRYDVSAVDKSPITRELQPPIIAMRAIDAMVKFSMILDDYLCQKGTCPTGTDITGLFYTAAVSLSKSGKSQKVETKLDPSIVVGSSHFKTLAKVYGLDEPVEVTLTCGIDIPDRNTLKRIESLNPKVSVITWGSDPLSFQYATVIEADGCRGIWAGPFSNLRVLQTERKSKK